VSGFCTLVLDLFHSTEFDNHSSRPLYNFLQSSLVSRNTHVQEPRICVFVSRNPQHLIFLSHSPFFAFLSHSPFLLFSRFLLCVFVLFSFLHVCFLPLPFLLFSSFFYVFLYFSLSSFPFFSLFYFLGFLLCLFVLFFPALAFLFFRFLSFLHFFLSTALG